MVAIQANRTFTLRHCETAQTFRLSSPSDVQNGHDQVLQPADNVCRTSLSLSSVVVLRQISHGVDPAALDRWTLSRRHGEERRGARRGYTYRDELAHGRRWRRSQLSVSDKVRVRCVIAVFERSS